jgi:hypothetical protein
LRAPRDATRLAGRRFERRFGFENRPGELRQACRLCGIPTFAFAPRLRPGASTRCPTPLICEPRSRMPRSLRPECLSLRLASSEIVEVQGRCPWWVSRASPSSAALRPALTPRPRLVLSWAVRLNCHQVVSELNPRRVGRYQSPVPPVERVTSPGMVSVMSSGAGPPLFGS